MTIKEAREAVEDRMFHGTSHLRYGKRACGPDCLGCNELRVYELLIHGAACSRRSFDRARDLHLNCGLRPLEGEEVWYCPDAPVGG